MDKRIFLIIFHAAYRKGYANPPTSAPKIILFAGEEKFRFMMDSPLLSAHVHDIFEGLTRVIIRNVIEKKKTKSLLVYFHNFLFF